MSDSVFQAFLRRQQEEGLALARESRLLDMVPFGVPPTHYLAHFTCRGLVRPPDGIVEEAENFAVGIRFPDDYLRRANPYEVLTWLGPKHAFHPNISATAPVICVGRLVPGTGLVDLIYQTWEIITWNKATIVEHDALNPSASQWARNHPGRWPVDRRPLKHRPPDFRIELVRPSDEGVPGSSDDAR